MSNEITLYASIKASKGETVISKIVSALKVDWAGNRFVHNRQSVGITEEALDLGDISTGGLFLAINQDGVNFVELRAGTGLTDFVRLNAGEFCLFRMSGDAAAPFAIAATAACALEYFLLED